MMWFMDLWKKIKYIVIAIGSLIVSLWLGISAYQRGKKSGEKKIRKEVERAEKERNIKQQKVNEIQNHAIREAMDVTPDNAVDHFNRMFDSSDDHPPQG